MEKDQIDPEEYINNLPVILKPQYELSQTNEPIVIYSGDFQLTFEDGEIELQGQIVFSWKTSPHIYLKAEVLSNWFYIESSPIGIKIAGTKIEHGKILLSGQKGTTLKGIITGPFIIIYEETATEKISFELPNFIEYFGSRTKRERHFYSSRLQWYDGQTEITIDQLPNLRNVLAELKDEGGFGLSHTGEIRSKADPIPRSAIPDIISRLGMFLSFLNGRKTTPILLKAYSGERCIWADYTPLLSDPYIQLDSWYPFLNQPGLSELWQGFSTTIKLEDDYQCIDYMLHWLFEANKNSALVEGSIVLLQNAFELLYNWKLKTKNDDKISADKKIRRLLQHAQIDTGFHADYHEMVSELRSNGLNFKDFPELFTLIRNAIVHSDRKKRTQLNKYSGINKFYIKHIALHHMELLLLHLFGYKGKYRNRLPMVRYRGTDEEYVPWAKPQAEP